MTEPIIYIAICALTALFGVERRMGFFGTGISCTIHGRFSVFRKKNRKADNC